MNSQKKKKENEDGKTESEAASLVNAFKKSMMELIAESLAEQQEKKIKLQKVLNWDSLQYTMPKD